MISRRTFIAGLPALVIANQTAAQSLSAAGLSSNAYGQQPLRPLPVLSGKNIELSLSEQLVNITGKSTTATLVNNSLPAPVLRWREGDVVNIRVKNTMPHASSIHWHGLILPSEMDGVPGLSFKGIPSKGEFQYQFQLKQSGTYWYHSHSGFQEQTGLYGAIVIEPKVPDKVDRDYVVMLSDWSDEKPERIFANLRKNSHFYNRQRRNAGNMIADITDKGVGATLRDRQMWNQMRMQDSDIADVTGFTYTYLMNGQSPSTGWEGMFSKGERIKLRMINAAAMTFFDIRVPGLKMKVVAMDGQDVEPISVDDIRLGVAETIDVIVEPQEDIPYAIFAQAMDRSGYSIGYLTPKIGLPNTLSRDLPGEFESLIPAMDAVPRLTHADMGGGSMAMPNSNSMSDSSDHVHHHDHGSMGQDDKNSTVHQPTEYGPHVDMLATSPQYRLSDPGVGLRDHHTMGRKVLTYSEIKNRERNLSRDVDEEIELHLTGNMRRYIWSINGVPYSDAEPLQWRFGSRKRITFVNDTMMNHPMHLHGMWSELETGDDQYLPKKHTVIVQPGSKISYQVNVDAKGKWAYHCHLMYHMMGMFREVHVT